ncbi:hypothetical protein [Psychromicrobium lacuslunae]|uniref:Uncharacterized protein n=1 Tax=Psychromicrobium lacuslunae TaxID=1618207 RepID=A0A0D4BYG8_9MICC|nr:hypothetical protein [Psychromicrobium lacuslunae]AJT41170.1 hypothetical protein UM93_05935 [Psychromicrobium lacuslunae]
MNPKWYYLLIAVALILIAVGIFNVIIGALTSRWPNIITGFGLIIGFGLSLRYWIRALRDSHSNHQTAPANEP